MFSVQIGHQSCRTSYPDSSWFSIVNIGRPSENQANLLKVDDQRGLLSKIGYTALAIFNLLAVAFQKSIQRLSSWISGEKFPEAQRGEDEKYHYPEAELSWSSTDTESAGLFLDVHGLRGNPKDWQLFSEKNEEKSPGSHHVSPKVVNGGNCVLDLAAEPFLEIVVKYLTQFPGRPVTLIGTSNGGCIIQYIETHLDPKMLGNSTLSFVSIAGVHYGTELFDIADKMGILWAANLDENRANDFHWGSEGAVRNLAAWQEKQVVWQEENKNVRHLFCASLEDEQVFSISSSLPLPPKGLNAKYDYKIYQGESHISIVPAACKDIVEWLHA